MPGWLTRMVWNVKGKRLVRLHLKDGAPSLEGILVGYWDYHYILLAPKLLEAEGATVSMDGHLEVPSARVLFVQVLNKGP